MNYKIRGDQVHTLIKALDLYSRIFMGQYSEIEWCLRLNTRAADGRPLYEVVDENELQMALLKVRDLAMPALKGYGFHGSYGIWSADNDRRSVEAFDLEQVIRHSDAWFRNPEGGIGTHFDRPWIHGRFSKMKAECVGTKENYQMLLSDITEDQLDIILESLRVSVDLYNLEFVKMLKHFTDREDAIAAMQEVEALYDSIAIPECFYDFNGLLKDFEKGALDG